MKTMHHFSFTLTMPNNNSWNGKWSGDGVLYCRVISVQSKESIAKLSSLIGDHYYSFGDGWGANVKVKEVSGQEKRLLNRRSQGFCGYDWMIDSLRSHGKIMNSLQVRDFIAKPPAESGGRAVPDADAAP